MKLRRGNITLRKVAALLALTSFLVSGLLIHVPNVYAAQYGVPTSDTSVGSWTTSPLWSKVDDNSGSSPSGDGTTISSEAIGNNSNSSNADLKLSTLTDPSSSSGHVLRVRWNNGGEGGNGRDIIGHFELWEGAPGSGTMRAEVTAPTLPGSSTTEVETTLTLSGAQADSITDYSNLYVRLWARGSGGGPSRTLRVDLVELEVPDAVAVTTLGDGTDPGNSTIAPGASVADLDAFTFQTNIGSDTITAVTVTLAPAGAFNNISKVEITNTSNTDQCTDIDNPSGLTLNFTGCTLSAGTGATTYKVRITPKTHANMAAPASGASYAVTGTVTDWTGTNTTHAGSDTDSATITIDNLSPANVTGATATSAIEAQVSLSWTNPVDGDHSETLILRRASSAVTDVPEEGVSYFGQNGDPLGDSIIACYFIEPSGLGESCDDDVTNGVVYHFKIFTKDSRGNWSDGGTVPTGSPVTPGAATLSLAAYRFFEDSTSVTPGTALEVQDTPATLVSAGDPFRMRILVHVGTNGIASSGKTLKLQYAAKSDTCDTSFTGETYADITTATPISYYDTAGISDDSALGAQADLTHGGDTIVNQTYEEANNFTNSQASILSGQDGKWDFSLYDNGATADASYCIRAINSNDTELDSYSVVAEIIMATASPPSLSQLHYRWRKDNKSETNTSWDENEDTILSSGVFVGDRRRLRILLQNTGGPATNYEYRLEYSSGACSSWSAVPNMESSDPWTMSTSVYITNDMATTNNSGLTDPGGSAFVSGYGKAASNTTSSHTLAGSQFTEHEFVVRSTDTAETDTTYCFRLTNAGSTTNFTYSVTAQISIPNQARPQKGSGNNLGNVGSGAPQTGGTEDAPDEIEEEGTGEPETGGTEGGGGGELE